MKKGRALWLWLLVAVSATFTWLLLPKEPRYEGRSLSAWLEDLSGPPWAKGRAQIKQAIATRRVGAPGSPVIATGGGYGVLTPPEQEARRQKAIEALRAMGTNALPLLLDRMNGSDSAFRKTLMGLAAKQSILPMYFRTEAERKAQAFQGIGALGQPAIPILERLLDDKNHARDGAVWLGRMGPEAFPALMRALTNDSKAVRDVAVGSISRMQSEAPRIVPAMMERLCDNDPAQRKNAAIILGNLGSDAKPAVRSLLKMLNDEEVNARRAASNALTQIDPLGAEQLWAR